MIRVASGNGPATTLALMEAAAAAGTGTTDAPSVAALGKSAGGGKVKEIEKDTPANGAVFYCAEVKGTDGQWTKVYVTEAGVFMKTEPDNARNKRKHKPLFG